MILNAPPLPTDPRSEEIADWAELTAIRRGSLRRGNLSTEVGRNGADINLVADAWQELESRSLLSKSSWIFSISSTKLTRICAAKERLVLPTFLAALGLRENIEQAHRSLFEQCVAELVTALMPSSIRIGFPRRPPVPSPFGQALAEYAGRCNESIVSAPPTSDNDLKMDVVAWHEFGDGRGAYPHLIGQCATGADWQQKLDELNLELIRDYLSWAVPPMRFFATPHVVPEQHLRRVSQRAGLVLDRPRLIELEAQTRLHTSTRAEVESALADLY